MGDCTAVWSPVFLLYSFNKKWLFAVQNNFCGLQFAIQNEYPGIIFQVQNTNN